MKEPADKAGSSFFARLSVTHQPTQRPGETARDMTRPRLALLIASAVLAVACAGTGPPNSGGVNPVPSIDPATAREQLCDPQSNTSLNGLADSLSDLPTGGTGEIAQRLASAEANVDALQVDSAALPTRDAAATALENLREVISNPDARDEAASQAADALRALDQAVCA